MLRVAEFDLYDKREVGAILSETPKKVIVDVQGEPIERHKVKHKVITIPGGRVLKPSELYGFQTKLPMGKGHTTLVSVDGKVYRVQKRLLIRDMKRKIRRERKRASLYNILHWEK